MLLDSYSQTKDFILFVENSRSFCKFLEIHQSDNYKTFMLDTQKQLVVLYTFAQALPSFDLPANTIIEEANITYSNIKDLLSFIAKRLHDPFYWVVFDPTDHNDTSSVCADLVDDLGDLYKDLKSFLIGFDNKDDDVKQNALWYLKWSFDNHWNDHCINAIYAIHYMLKQAD